MFSERKGGQAILDHLGEHEAVLTNSHFVYTSGMHGSAYINMRQIAHQQSWLNQIGQQLGHRVSSYKPDLVLGPETLGRTLAEKTAPWVTPDCGIWCDVSDVDGNKVATFSNKLNFGRLIPGKRVAIVDDLLTTGSSLMAASKLVQLHGGEVVVAGVVVRRSSDVLASACGAPDLEVLAEVKGFAVYAEEECQQRGPCSQNVPVQLRPGHGWSWAENNPDYPTA